MDTKIKIIQVYYNELGKNHIDPAFIPFDNSATTNPYFENELISRLIGEGSHLDCQYWGLLSWSVKWKAPYFFCNLSFTGETLIEEIKANPDVDIFCLNHAENNPIPFIKTDGHPYMEEIASLIFKEFGNIIIKNVYCERGIYMNANIIRSPIYSAYVKGFLNPIMAIMNDPSNKRLQQLLWRDSLYKTSEVNDDRRERFKKSFGVQHYPLHAFVAERLMSYFLTLSPKQFKVKYL
jgi:hypothetical protein